MHEHIAISLPVTPSHTGSDALHRAIRQYEEGEGGGGGILRFDPRVKGYGHSPGWCPAGPFWWRDEASGAQLIAMWHPGGYSGDPVDGRDECKQVLCSLRLFCGALL